MRFLNYRAWQDNPEGMDADPDDFDEVDDDEAADAYWKAVDEAMQMVKDGVWE